jgi:L-asparaginase
VKRVLLLATGGTIALSLAPERMGIRPGADLLATLPPGATDGVRVEVDDVMSAPSWDLEPAAMLGIARRARDAIIDQGFDGVVITHGTDTLEENAYLTDLLAGHAADRAGIVVTGAMRKLSDLSTDGPGNLASSITAAVDPALRGAGVVACMGDELHAARWVTKVDATSVAAFSSAPYPVLGRVVDGRVETVAPPPRRPPPPLGEPESSVALIKIYPGIESAQLTAVVDAGVRGIVLEGTGASNVPVSLFAAIHELTSWDIPVVVASRCRTREASLAEIGDGADLVAKMGAIGARGLAPVKARAALMVALGSGGVDAVRDWFSRV